MIWLLDHNVWASLLTLTALEIVLGADNLVFIALLAGRLPPERRDAARKIGMALALGTRLALLGSISWLIHLTEPVLTVGALNFSWRHLVLFSGGAFLLFKGTREIHLRVDSDEADRQENHRRAGFVGTIVQIMLFDLVFSLDSVVTAVGIADHLSVMVVAIVLAMALMLMASAGLAGFIERHESLRMLALSFLILIGMMLVADGFDVHIPRGYVYAAMGFSALVESLNLLAARRRAGRTRANQKLGKGALVAIKDR
jgi:predicted tellurium resistance membrane protein TerC